MTYKCKAPTSSIYLEPDDSSEMVSQILFGETCTLIESEGEWSKVKMDFDGVEGWVMNINFEEFSEGSFSRIISESYSLYSDKIGSALISMGSELYSENASSEENLASPEKIAELAKKFFGVPYLKGGRSFFGVDDAGFVQLVFKVFGINLPRFAEKIAELGQVLDFIGESEAGDLAFFENDEGINHVGIMLNSYEVIHVYGQVRIDSLDSLGIYNNDLKKHTHNLRFVKRIF